LSSSEQCEYGYEKLFGLVGAAFTIGVHATATNGAKNYFRPAIAHEAKVARARAANVKKAETDAASRDQLDRAVMAEMDSLKAKFAPALSDKYAQILRPGITKRLGRSKGTWPSVRTIRDSVKRIVKHTCEGKT
jgi:hypothetical protein